MTRHGKGAGGIGVFGGTFDPIHLGHLISAEAVRTELRLDRILFVPNRQPVHKLDHPVTPWQDRVEMVRLAIESNPFFELDLAEVERGGPSYAVDTMRELRQRFPAKELLLILGADALLGLQTWYEPDALLAEGRLAVMDRPAQGRTVLTSEVGSGRLSRLGRRFPELRSRVDFVRVPQIDISAHDIRARVAKGTSIRYLVSQPIQTYIEERGLYQEP